MYSQNLVQPCMTRFNDLTSCRLKVCNTEIVQVTGQLSEWSFVQSGVVRIPKFDSKPNPNPDHNPSPIPNPMPICFGQMALWTNDPSDK